MYEAVSVMFEVTGVRTHINASNFKMGCNVRGS